MSGCYLLVRCWFGLKMSFSISNWGGVFGWYLLQGHFVCSLDFQSQLSIWCTHTNSQPLWKWITVIRISIWYIYQNFYSLNSMIWVIQSTIIFQFRYPIWQTHNYWRFSWNQKEKEMGTKTRRTCWKRSWWIVKKTFKERPRSWTLWDGRNAKKSPCKNYIKRNRFLDIWIV